MVAQFVEGATEACRCVNGSKTTHRIIPLFDASMILLQPIVFVGAGPVLDAAAQRRADRARVGAVPVRGDAVGDQAGGRLGGAEERLRGRHVPVLGEHGVDQVAMAANGNRRWKWFVSRQ